MVGLELSIAGGEELHLSSPGNKPEPAADASRDAIEREPYSAAKTLS
jgi:hypothetical protein